MIYCPKCKSRAVGRIGQNQYYCWDCNIEFIPAKDGFRMYRLEPDGTVMPETLGSVAPGYSLSGTLGERLEVARGTSTGETSDGENRQSQNQGKEM